MKPRLFLQSLLWLLLLCVKPVLRSALACLFDFPYITETKFICVSVDLTITNASGRWLTSCLLASWLALFHPPPAGEFVLTFRSRRKAIVAITNTQVLSLWNFVIVLAGLVISSWTHRTFQHKEFRVGNQCINRIDTWLGQSPATLQVNQVSGQAAAHLDSILNRSIYFNTCCIANVKSCDMSPWGNSR